MSFQPRLRAHSFSHVSIHVHEHEHAHGGANKRGDRSRECSLDSICPYTRGRQSNGRYRCHVAYRIRTPPHISLLSEVSDRQGGDRRSRTPTNKNKKHIGWGMVNSSARAACSVWCGEDSCDFMACPHQRNGMQGAMRSHTLLVPQHQTHASGHENKCLHV